MEYPHVQTQLDLESALKATRQEDRGLALTDVAKTIKGVYDQAEVEALIEALKSNQ